MMEETCTGYNFNPSTPASCVLVEINHNSFSSLLTVGQNDAVLVTSKTF